MRPGLLLRGGLLFLAVALVGCASGADTASEPMEEVEAPAYVPPDFTPESRDLDQADVERLMEELSNWGRWGADDQLGAANLITPEKRLEALALATEGITVSLAHRVLKEEADDVPRPFGHSMLGVPDPTAEPGFFGGVSDNYEVSYHGYSHSPPRLAVPHPLQGEDVQRRVARHDHRGRVFQRVDRQPAGRHRGLAACCSTSRA